MTLLWLAVATASGLDLDEARALAVQRSLEVEAASARADAAGAGAGSALLAELPAVVAFADASTGAGLTPTGFERPAGVLFGVGAEGRWRLLDPAGWSAATAARRRARGQEALYEWARVEARRSATTAYAEALGAQVAVEARVRASSDATAGADAIASLVEAGLRPPVDGARARAAAASARAALATAEADAAGRCAQLQALVRAPVGDPCHLEPVTWGAPGAARPIHPALEAAQAAFDATRAERGAATWALGPAVTLRGTAAAYATDEGLGPGWSAGARAEAPLGTGSVWSDLRGARAERDEARAGLEAQEVALQIAAVEAEARLEAARAIVGALAEATEAASEAYALTDARYRAGLDGITPWLAARAARDEAAVAQAGGEAALGRALADVEAARGVW